MNALVSRLPKEETERKVKDRKLAWFKSNQTVVIQDIQVNAQGKEVCYNRA